MRKCFKCDRSQKRRRLLSGNAVKGSQHFALPARALSHSLSFLPASFFAICVQWRRVAILCLELQWSTACEKLLRAAARALTLELKKTLSRCICRVSLSLFFSLSFSHYLAVSVSVAFAVPVAGFSLPFSLFPIASLSLSVSLSACLCLSLFPALSLFCALPL